MVGKGSKWFASYLRSRPGQLDPVLPTFHTIGALASAASRDHLPVRVSQPTCFQKTPSVNESPLFARPTLKCLHQSLFPACHTREGMVGFHSLGANAMQAKNLTVWHLVTSLLSLQSKILTILGTVTGTISVRSTLRRSLHHTPITTPSALQSLSMLSGLASSSWSTNSPTLSILKQPLISSNFTFAFSSRLFT